MENRERNNNDDLFRQMAKRYVEQYGEALHQERNTLTDSQTDTQSGAETLDFRMMSLDRKVQREMKLRLIPQTLRHAKPSAAAAALVAACLICALLAVLIPFSNRGGSMNTATQDQLAEAVITAQTLEDSAGNNGAVGNSATGNAAMDTTGNTQNSVIPGSGDDIAKAMESEAAQESEALQESETRQEYEFLQESETLQKTESQQDSDSIRFEPIALRTTLPPQYEITQVKQDGDKTIYKIESTDLDNMIITLVKTSEYKTLNTTQDLAREQAGFIKVSLPSATGGLLEAQALSKADYNLLVFHTEGIDYELSCRYDINSLLTLGTLLI